MHRICSAGSTQEHCQLSGDSTDSDTAVFLDLSYSCPYTASFEVYSGCVYNSFFRYRIFQVSLADSRM